MDIEAVRQDSPLQSDDIGTLIVTAFDESSTAYAEKSPASGVSSTDVSPRASQLPGKSHHHGSRKKNSGGNDGLARFSVFLDLDGDDDEDEEGVREGNMGGNYEDASRRGVVATDRSTGSSDNNLDTMRTKPDSHDYNSNATNSNSTSNTNNNRTSVEERQAYFRERRNNNASFVSATTNNTTGNSPYGSPLQREHAAIGAAGLNPRPIRRGSDMSSVAYDDLGQASDVWSDVDSSSEYANSAPTSARGFPSGVSAMSNSINSNSNSSSTMRLMNEGGLYISPRPQSSKRHSVHLHRAATTQPYNAANQIAMRKVSISHSLSESTDLLRERERGGDMSSTASTSSWGDGNAGSGLVSMSVDSTVGVAPLMMNINPKSSNKSLLSRLTSAVSSPFTPRKEKKSKSNKYGGGGAVVLQSNTALNSQSGSEVDSSFPLAPTAGSGSTLGFLRANFMSPPLPHSNTTSPRGSFTTGGAHPLQNSSSFNASTSGAAPSASAASSLMAGHSASEGPCIRISFQLDSRYKLCCADPQGDFSDRWAVLNAQFHQVFYLYSGCKGAKNI